MDQTDSRPSRPADGSEPGTEQTSEAPPEADGPEPDDGEWVKV